MMSRAAAGDFTRPQRTKRAAQCQIIAFPFGGPTSIRAFWTLLILVDVSDNRLSVWWPHPVAHHMSVRFWQKSVR